MAKKKILVACGTGIATSTVVVNKVKETLTAKGLDVIVDQCKASEVPGKAASYDLIIATTPVSGNGDTPVIRTLSFLTGIGIDKDVEAIIEKLQS
jgi:PTS system galactitol-specific IIB component